jgi:hypothetical protein
LGQPSSTETRGALPEVNYKGTLDLALIVMA